MGFGQALETTLESQGDTKQNAAKIAMVDNSTLGKYTKGTRQPPKAVMQRLTEKYDDPQLYLAAHSEVTGEASIPWLNNVDLHHAVTHIKAIEEVEEALAALKATPITKRRDQMSDQELVLIRVAIKESIQTITALTHHVAVLCKEYCFSWMGMWREHRREMKDKKYIS